MNTTNNQRLHEVVAPQVNDNTVQENFISPKAMSKVNVINITFFSVNNLIKFKFILDILSMLLSILCFYYGWQYSSYFISIIYPLIKWNVNTIFNNQIMIKFNIPWYHFMFFGYVFGLVNPYFVLFIWTYLSYKNAFRISYYDIDTNPPQCLDIECGSPKSTFKQSLIISPCNVSTNFVNMKFTDIPVLQAVNIMCAKRDIFDESDPLDNGEDDVFWLVQSKDIDEITPIDDKVIDVNIKPIIDVIDCIREIDFDVNNSEIQSSIIDLKVFIKQNDWCIRLMEDLMFFYKGILPLAKKDGITDWKLVRNIALMYWKSRTSKSLLLSALDSDFVKCLEEYLSELNDDDEQEPQALDFETVIGTARSALDAFDDLKHSTFFKKVYKLIMYGMAHSLFEKLGISMSSAGFSLFQQEAIKRKYHLGVDFVHVLCDSLLFLCEKGYQIIRTGRVDCIFHSSKTYTEFFDRVEKLRRNYLFINNPEPNGFDEHSFRKELDDLIEIGDAISKYTSPDAFEKKVLMSQLNELWIIKATMCTKAAAREPRAAPFSILINGESGIGKSTIKEMLFKHFGKVNNLPIDSTYCYTRNSVAKFWDGFTTSQWCINLDDVAFMHPNKAPSGDPSVMEFIQIINPTPFTPDQADLSDKGRTPLRAKLCVATTNTKHLNAHYYFSHASAVQRRFPYVVTPFVKEQYRCSDSFMLDSTKLPADYPGYPDIWDWTIERVIPVSAEGDQKCAKFEIVKNKVSLKEFLIWFNESIEKFNKDQNQMIASLGEIHDLVLCDSCHLTSDMCVCSTVQSLTETTARWYSNLAKWFVTFLMHIYFHSSCFKWLFMFLQLDIKLKRYARETVSRVVMANLGANAQIQIGLPFILISVVGMVTAIRTMYKAYDFFTPQGADLSTVIKSGEKVRNDPGRAPVGNDKIENVWYKDDFILNHMDLSPASKSSKGLDRGQFCKLVGASTVYLQGQVGDNKVRVGKGVCVKGQVYMTNNHIIPVIPKGETRFLIVTFMPKTTGVSENVTVTIDETLITRFAQGDILLIRLPIPNKKGVYDYLPNQSMSIKENGFYISRDKNGNIVENNVSRIRCEKYFKYVFEDINYSFLPFISMADNNTVDGDCGSLLVAETNYGYVVIGLHVRGVLSNKTANAAALPVDKFIVDKLLDSFPPQFDEGHVMISAPSSERALESLHKKSALRFMPSGTATVLGSYAGFRPHLKSRVEVTPMAYHLPDFKIRYGAPVMKGWEPWYKAANDLCKPNYTYTPAILSKVSEGFYNDIISQLPKEELQKLCVYDDFTTINGAHSVRFVDKINRNTSAGLPWRCSKRNFMTLYGYPICGLSDAVKVDDEVMDRVYDIIDNYKKGFTAHPVTCGNLKDEARSFAKIASASTRLFNGIPLDFSIVERKYYLSSVRMIQNNQYIFEAFPGLVCQSNQWGKLYRYLTHHGVDRMIAGDFATFDKNMISAFILEAFNILIKICKLSGNFSDDDIKVMFGISYDIAFPMIDLNGDLLRLWCSNPSGHPLTVIINCLVNSLYMRYAYYVCNPAHEVKTFRKFVNLATYGDDNVLNVNRGISWFNHTSIQSALADIGVVYTMADKIQESVPFVNIKDVTFLKRRWVFNDEVGDYLAPLEFDSIQKRLMVWTRSKSVSREEQGIDIISDSVKDMWFYGREEFENFSNMMRKLVKDMEWNLWIKESTFPTWNELHDMWKEHSKVLPPQSKNLRCNKKQNMERIKKRLDLRVNALIEAAERMVLNEVPIGGIKSITPESENSSIIFIDWEDECVLGDDTGYTWV